MGILDDLMVNAKSAAEVLSKKTGQLVDASKLKWAQVELNNALRSKYETLGQYVAENWGDALSGSEELAAQLSEINELKEQLAVLNKDLNDKSNKVVCPVCGKASSSTAAFCSVCGAKLVTEEPETAEEVVKETVAEVVEEAAAVVEDLEKETPDQL